MPVTVAVTPGTATAVPIAEVSAMPVGVTVTLPTNVSVPMAVDND